MEGLDQLASRSAALSFAERNVDSGDAAIDVCETDSPPLYALKRLVSRHRLSGLINSTTADPAVIADMGGICAMHTNRPGWEAVHIAVTTSAVFSVEQAGARFDYLQQIAPILAMVGFERALGSLRLPVMPLMDCGFQSPFEQISALRESQLSAVIDCVGIAYRVPYAERLRARLQDLQVFWAEDHEPEEQLSIDALSGLLIFLSAHHTLKMPEILTSPEGNWLAQWRRDSEHVFIAHFLNASEARFSVVARPEHSKATERQSWGTIAIGGLLDIARAYGALDWMSEP